MIRLSLLLLGTSFARRNWHILLAAGLFWLAVGVGLVIDALDGVLYFPLRLFAGLLLVEGLVSLAVSLSGLARHIALRLAKGILFVLIALLMLARPTHGDFVLAMLFGLVFAIGGGLRISAAWVVRFRGWRWATLAGVLELLFAAFILEPWPTHYVGTIPYCVGIGLALTGWALVRIAVRLHHLPVNSPASLLSPRSHAGVVTVSDDACDNAPMAPLVVHIWTPMGSAIDPLHRPVIDRYIAAVDANGVISTGHAALELPPDVYISHYPDVEIDRSPGEFNRTLLATHDNDVAGRFQPSYAEESAAWCESTEKIAFADYHPAQLRRFWASYRSDRTYNLTNRNCSSTVAVALEAALDGVLGRRGGGWRTLLRVVTSPELWVASQLYRRAETMAWTPGLVLDYARSLHGIVHPQPMSWLLLARRARAGWRVRARTRTASTPPVSTRSEHS